MDETGDHRYAFSTELWEYGGEASWTFASVPADLSGEIRLPPRPRRPGFGSIHVKARLGSSVWSTSIFPDSKRGCYLLPVKEAVRVAERVGWGDTVSIELELDP